MNNEKLVIWEDPDRDEDQEDKSANLLEHLKQYEVEVLNVYTMMPMVLVKVTAEQAEALENDKELVVEDNGKVYALPVEKLDSKSTKPPNCS